MPTKVNQCYRYESCGIEHAYLPSYPWSKALPSDRIFTKCTTDSGGCAHSEYLRQTHIDKIWHFSRPGIFFGKQEKQIKLTRKCCGDCQRPNRKQFLSPEEKKGAFVSTGKNETKTRNRDWRQ